MFFLKVIGTGSSGNCYIVSDGNQAILLECGLPWKKMLRGADYNPSIVVGCLATHFHGDHLGADYKKLINSGIPILANAETAEKAGGVKAIAEKKWQKIGSFKYLLFPVPHDGTPCSGAIIELPNKNGRLLYATDFEYLPKTFRSQDINFWLIECNHCSEYVKSDDARFSHSVRGHSSLATVKGVVAANKTASMRTVILCHMSEQWGDPGRMRSEVQKVAGNEVNVEIAEAGKSIPLRLYPWEETTMEEI